MNEAVHAWGGVIVASVLAIPVGLLIAVALANRRTRTGAPRRQAWATAGAEVGMVLGTLPWIWMILTPRPGRSQLELVPGLGLAELLAGEPSTVVVQVGGNLLVFAAFGFLAPIRWPLHPLAVAALVARPWWRRRSLAGSWKTPAGRVRPAAGDDGVAAER